MPENCANCGRPLPPYAGRGRYRLFCDARCRREKYRFQCVECGTQISYGGGKGREPERCRACEAERQERLRRHGRNWVIESIQEWAERFGAPPSAADWNRAMARRTGMTWKVERYEATGRSWPSISSTLYYFGTWNDAIEAAGFEPIRAGQVRAPRRKRRLKWTREDAIEAANRWVAYHHRLPRWEDWNRNSVAEARPSAQAIRDLYGSWTAFITDYVENHYEPSDEVAA